MRDFKSLNVWRRAFDFAAKIYEITGNFPKEEIYSLTSQLRRASVSVFSNISEGCGKDTDKDLVKFLYNAMGSVREVEAQLLFSGRIGYIEKAEMDVLVAEAVEIGKILMGYIKCVVGGSK